MCLSHILSADVCEHVLSFSVELAAAVSPDSPRTFLRRNYYELFRGETLYYKPLVLSCAFCKCFRLNSLFLCVKTLWGSRDVLWTTILHPNFQWSQWNFYFWVNCFINYLQIFLVFHSSDTWLTLMCSSVENWWKIKCYQDNLSMFVNSFSLL